MSDKMIYINDYISFNTEDGWFTLSPNAPSDTTQAEIEPQDNEVEDGNDR